MTEFSSMKTWMLAIRPKTLPAAVAPVLIGFSLAFREREHHYSVVFFAVLTALLIQVGTNLVNDYVDFKKGTDNEERRGPVRVTQAGLVSAKGMKKAMFFVLVLIVVSSIPLIVRGGVPILLIGVFSILSGILYTAGPYPLGYIGLGDIFVLLFFGPVATAGTYYVQTLKFDITSVIAGLGPGLLSVAILCVNNLRDVESDRKAGKNTLVVMFGKFFGRMEYLFSLQIAVLIPVIIILIGESPNYSVFVAIVLIPSIKSVRIVFSDTEERLLNEMLGYTGKILLLYSFIFSIGWQFAL